MKTIIIMENENTSIQRKLGESTLNPEITLQNGIVLKVGEKYTKIVWEENKFVKVVALGQKCFLGLNQYSEDCLWEIDMDWLPYKGPKVGPAKPLKEYQKYYADNGNGMLFVQYWAIRPSNTPKMKWYSESEAIELGLTI